MRRVVQAVIFAATSTVACGQVVFDGELGSAGLLGPDQPGGVTFTVPQDRGASAGMNLFHSFSEFHVGSGETVRFTSTDSFQNVIARVTGIEVPGVNDMGTIELTSQINGSIVSDIAGANLVLMNAHGFAFKDGTQVHVDGAFRATTADYLLFEDDQGNALGKFWASGGKDVSLLVSPPSAFGFEAGTGNGGEIRVKGEDNSNGIFVVGFPGLSDMGLSTGDEDLHLVGRAVIVEETFLQSTGGEVGVVAVGPDKGTVTLDAETGRLGNIDATGGKVSIRKAVVTGAGHAGADRGRVVIRGDKIEASEARTLFDAVVGRTYQGIAASAGQGGPASEILMEANETVLHSGAVVSAQSGGIIRIDGESLRVSKGRIFATAGEIQLDLAGDLVLENEGAIFSGNGTSDRGAAAPLRIDLDGELVLRSGGKVESTTLTGRDGGSIHVTAGALRIDQGVVDTFTGILSQTLGAGRGGRLAVKVNGPAHIEEVGQVASLVSASGAGGEIVFSADSLRIVGASVDPGNPGMVPNYFLTGLNAKAGVDATGPTGAITVDVAGRITLNDGGLINAAGFSAEANAGDVTVTAGSIVADKMDSYFFTGIGAGSAINSENSMQGEAGNGGAVKVTAGSIALFNGAQINAATRGSGNAGSIKVVTNEIVADGIGIDPGEFPQFTYSRPSGILAQALEGSDGDGGSIEIESLPGGATPADGLPTIELTDGAEIAALSDGTGSAGSVDIHWGHGIVTVGNRSAISARAGTEARLAGSVTLSEAGILRVREGGTIESLSLGTGSAGDLKLTADRIEVIDGSLSVAANQARAGSLVLRSHSDLILTNSSLSAASAGLDGGNIRISAVDLILAEKGTDIVAGAGENAGNLFVTDARYFLLNESAVTANAVNQRGGTIAITTQVFLENESTVAADSQFGAAGVVRIDPQFVLTGTEGEIEVDLLDETDSLQRECTEQIATEAGSFIKSGRGGTRRLPGGYLPSLRLVSVGESSDDR